MRKNRQTLQRLAGSMILCAALFTSAYASTPEVVDTTRTYRIGEVVVTGSVCALSFPGYWYETIKSYLSRSMDLLTWEHRKSQLQLLLSATGRRMLHDPQLKVILVKDKGIFHR